MTRLRGKAGDVRALFALCFAIGTMGCGGERLGTLAATNAPPPGAPTNAAAYDSAISLYPRSGTPHVRDRCPDTFYCFKNEIKVSIEAMGTTSDINLTTGLGKAVPVAHLINLDKNKKEKYYDLLPGDQAEYDLWVNQKPASTALEWRIVGKIKATNELVYGPPTDLIPCHRYDVTKGATDADFAADKVREKGDCEKLGATVSSTKTNSLSFSSALGWIHSLQTALFDLRYGGGWIECSSGCCT